MATQPSNLPLRALAKIESGGTAFHVPSPLAHFLYGGDDFLFFLPSEETVFRGMGIQSGNADMRILDAKLAAGIHDELGHFDDAVFLHAVASFAERAVGGDVDHPQELVGQQHGVFLCTCIVGVYLGMAVEVVSGLVEGFFVEWGGDGYPPRWPWPVRWP